MIKINSHNIPDIEDIISKFYQGVWDNIKVKINSDEKIKLNDEEFDRKRKSYIEKFVDMDKRKLVDEGGLGREEVDKVIINELVEDGLIRRAPNDNIMYYLLTHDRLIDPLVNDLRQLQSEEDERQHFAEEQTRLIKERENYKRKSQKMLLYLSLISIAFLGAFAFYANLKRIEADDNRIEAERKGDSLNIEKKMSDSNWREAEEQTKNANNARDSANTERILAENQARQIDSLYKVLKKSNMDLDKKNNELVNANRIVKEKWDSLSIAMVKIDSQNVNIGELNYALQYYTDLLNRVDDSDRVTLINELSEKKNNTDALNDLKNSIILSSDALRSKSIKDAQAAYFVYKNIYAENVLDSIAKLIIKPNPFYYNHGINFDSQSDRKLLTSLDSTKILLTADDYVNSKLIQIHRNKIDTADILNLEESIVTAVNYATGANYLAVTTYNDILILDSALRTIGKFNYYEKLLPQDDFDKFEFIKRISFLTMNDENGQVYSILMLVNFENSGTKLIRIKNLSYDDPEDIEVSNSIRDFPGEAVFMNDRMEILERILENRDIKDSVFKMKSGKPDFDTTLTNIFKSKKVNFFDNDVSPDGKLTFKYNSEEFSHNNTNNNLSSLENLNTLYYYNTSYGNSYTLSNENAGVKLLGIDEIIVNNIFSSDNHLFTLTGDNRLLEWNYDPFPIFIDKKDLMEYEPLAFNIYDSVNYKIISGEEIPEASIERIPATLANKTLLENLRFVIPTATYPDNHNSTALYNNKNLAIVNKKLYEITGSIDDKLELVGSFINLSDELLFNSKFEEGLKIAKLGAEVDSSEVTIYANIALGFLLTNNMDSAKEIYCRYKDRLYYSYEEDFKKLERDKKEIIEKDNIQERINEIRKYLINC